MKRHNLEERHRFLGQLASGKSVLELSEEIGVKEATIKNWMRETGKIHASNLIAKTDISGKIKYCEGILDNLFTTSMYNTGKTTALLAINSLLGTGLFILLQQQLLFTAFDFGIFGAALLAFLTSNIICLYQSIPQYNAKIGNEDNLRAIIGIVKFTKREQYYEEMRSLGEDDLLRFICYQISGMAFNNYIARRKIIYATYTSLIGYVFLGFVLVRAILLKAGMS